MLKWAEASRCTSRPVLWQTAECTRKIIADLESQMNVGVYRQEVKAPMCDEQWQTPGNWQPYRIARE